MADCGDEGVGGDQGKATWGDVPPTPTTQILEDPLEVVPELNPNEGVQYRVQAAVQVSDDLQHCHCCLQGVTLPTVFFFEQSSSVVYEDEVVGKMADDKHQNHSRHHSDCFVSLEAIGFLQGDDECGVAEDHDEQWQEEANGQLDTKNPDLHYPCSVAVGQFPLADILGIYSSLFLFGAIEPKDVVV